MLSSILRLRERSPAGKEDARRIVEPMASSLGHLRGADGAAETPEALRDDALLQRAQGDQSLEVDESLACFRHDENRLYFDTPIRTETPANDRVPCHLFDAATIDNGPLQRNHAKLLVA